MTARRALAAAGWTLLLAVLLALGPGGLWVLQTAAQAGWWRP